MHPLTLQPQAAQATLNRRLVAFTTMFKAVRPTLGRSTQTPFDADAVAGVSLVDRLLLVGVTFFTLGVAAAAVLA